jgi:four helix bundle suffix protein
MARDDLPLLPHGGYRKLRSYVVARAIFDATVVFCRRFFASDPRMRSQMVKAARSGVRNISEGCGAAATSRKSEMLLTNVARASLNDELLHDYESFLKQNGLRVWPKDSAKALAMRERLRHDDTPIGAPVSRAKVHLTGLGGLAEFVGKADAEIAANAMICSIHQAACLLKRQLEAQGRQFAQEGGFTEKMYRARQEARHRQSREFRQVRPV